MFVFLTTRSKLRYLNYDDLRKKAANNIEEDTTTNKQMFSIS